MNIVFDLSPIVNEVDGVKTIPIPYLQAKGYDKKYITLVFAKLDQLNYGIFNKGKCGRYNVGIFYPNDNCPLIFNFEIKDNIYKKDLYEF